MQSYYYSNCVRLFHKSIIKSREREKFLIHEQIIKCISNSLNTLFCLDIRVHSLMRFSSFYASMHIGTNNAKQIRKKERKKQELICISCVSLCCVFSYPHVQGLIVCDI